LKIAARTTHYEFLDASSGNKSRAVKILQIGYKTLLTELKKYNLTSEEGQNFTPPRFLASSVCLPFFSSPSNQSTHTWGSRG
jgi:hypothetical protein